MVAPFQVVSRPLLLYELESSDFNGLQRHQRAIVTASWVVKYE